MPSKSFWSSVSSKLTENRPVTSREIIMPLYEVEVYETVVTRRLYTVEADDKTEALEKAEIGDTENEVDLKLGETAGRDVLADTLELVDEVNQENEQ